MLLSRRRCALRRWRRRRFSGNPEAGRGFAFRAFGNFVAAALALRGRRLANLACLFFFGSKWKQADAGGRRRREINANRRRRKQTGKGCSKQTQAEANAIREGPRHARIRFSVHVFHFASSADGFQRTTRYCGAQY